MRKVVPVTVCGYGDYEDKDVPVHRGLYWTG